jgi:hypothetical protein
MAEKIYYQDSNVTVTNARLVISGKAYQMSNITSVSMGWIEGNPPNRMPGAVPAALGLLVAFITYVADAVGVAFFIGVLLFVGGVILAAKAKKGKDKYIVNLGSASGETSALWSYDISYIRKIIDAINNAFAERG